MVGLGQDVTIFRLKLPPELRAIRPVRLSGEPIARAERVYCISINDVSLPASPGSSGKVLFSAATHEGRAVVTHADPTTGMGGWSTYAEPLSRLLEEAAAKLSDGSIAEGDRATMQRMFEAGAGAMLPQAVAR